MMYWKDTALQMTLRDDVRTCGCIRNSIWPPIRDEYSGEPISQVGRGNLIGHERLNVRAQLCKSRSRGAIDCRCVKQSW